MPKLLLVHNIKCTSQIFEKIDLPCDLSFAFLHAVILEKFSIPLSKQLLKTQRNGFIVHFLATFSSFL